MLDEFYRIAFRKKIYSTIEDLQDDLDLWMREFNEVRPHQGKRCFGKPPLQTFLDAPNRKKKCLPAIDGDQSAAARPKNRSANAVGQIKYRLLHVISAR